MKDKGNIDDLRWVRLFTPTHIPKYLVEQIAKRDYEVDDFFKYLEINCLRTVKEGPTLNPFFHLWALVDPENLVKGFLWFTIEPLTKDIMIQTYSVDKHYWGSKEAVLKLADHVKEIRKKGSLNKIYWITQFPKHSEKFNFKKSKNVLMEYNEEQETDGKTILRGSTTSRKHRPPKTGTIEIPGGSSERDRERGRSVQPVPTAVLT